MSEPNSGQHTLGGTIAFLGIPAGLYCAWAFGAWIGFGAFIVLVFIGLVLAFS